MAKNLGPANGALALSKGYVAWMLGLVAVFSLAMAGCGTGGDGPGDSDFDAEEYFEGQTIEFIVGFSPGGGFDTISRAFAQAAQEEELIPGNPSINIINIPGAGGAQGVQATLEASADGLSLGILHSRLVLGQLGGFPPFEGFDVTQMRLIGTATSSATSDLFCVHRDVATSWEEVLELDQPIVAGGTEPGPAGGSFISAFIEGVGGPVRVVYGFGGTAELMAAFDRGELTGESRCSEDNVPRQYPEWIEEGILVPLFWSGAPPSDEYLAQLGSGPVPHILDLPGLGITDEMRNVYTAIEEIGAFNRLLFLHPDTPDEVYDVWRQVFEDTVNSDTFIEIANAAGYEIAPGLPAEYDELLGMIDALSPDGRELFEEFAGAGQ
ncbi:MAG: hypothetical protein WD533_00755 [Dehalococcoidia bacterium]